MAPSQLVSIPPKPEQDSATRTRSFSHSPKRSPTKRSTAYLDGLRGLAAFLVFIQHYAGGFDMLAHEAGYGENGNRLIASLPFVRILLVGGNPAVSTFFVLSGYVLSQTPLKLLRKEEYRGATKLSLLSATLRRPIRLFMPCLVVGLLTALGMHLPGGPYNNGPYAPQSELGGEILRWLTTGLTYFNPFRLKEMHFWEYGMVMWTIPYEFLGSILVFALLTVDSMVSLEARYVVLLEILGMCFCMALGWWTSGCFIAGLILAYTDICSLDKLLYKKLSSRGQAVLFNIMFIVGWYLLCQPSGWGGIEGSKATPGWHTLTKLIPPTYDGVTFFRWWNSWGAILLVYSVLRLEWLQRFFSTRLLQYLGRISFMLYLVHIPIIWTLGDWVRCALGTCKIEEQEFVWKDKILVQDVGPTGFSLRFLIAMSILTIVCVPISELFVRVLDNPAVKIGRWMTMKMGLERKKRGKERANDDYAAQPLLGEMSEAR